MDETILDDLLGADEPFVEAAEHIVENASDSPQRRLALSLLRDAAAQFENAKYADLPPAPADPAAAAAQAKAEAAEAAEAAKAAPKRGGRA